MYSVILSLIISFVLFLPYISNNSYARVTGPCSNCHTMHNSQGGDWEVVRDTWAAGEPRSALVCNTCVGCHTGTNGVDDPTIPYVMGTSEPDFGKDGNTLAGGNFWWVADDGGNDDAKGHNVFGISGVDSALISGAPGQTAGTLGVCSPCHMSLKNGCESCHRTPKHHANDDTDETGTKLLIISEQGGWYRFLSGHDIQKGVEGIEHERWNYGANEYSHNEYLGNVHTGDFGFSLGNTTTAFCTGCHGQFHAEQKNESGQWIRHPSDAVICDPDKPDSEISEYAAAFGGKYDPDVPVARISLDSVSPTVTPGSDMVMCLSCHVAHGSPYPDMLRWDYDDMIAGEGKGNTDGCFKCHTEKN